MYGGILNYFHNGNFREFLHQAGGIFDFQNGNSRWSCFEVFQPVCEKHTSTSQTDRQLDRKTTYSRMTALCVASRGKKPDLTEPNYYVASLWSM